MSYFRMNFFLIICASCILYIYALIPFPPRIVKQPPTGELLFQVKTKFDEYDKPFVLECVAAGEPAPKYRWMKDGKHFDWYAYGDRISHQPDTGTLLIASPRDEDLGQYQCFAENILGVATSNSVFVRKAELNCFKDKPPISAFAYEGYPFDLTCEPPDGWPKPYAFWLIKDSNGTIKSIDNPRMTLDPEGNLWFSNVTREDASVNFNYVCAVVSMFRKEYKLGNRVLLYVIPTGTSASQNKHEPVLQYVTRENETALYGKEIKLFCIFGGTPLPQIVWLKDGIALRSSDRISQENHGKTLVIKDVNFEDAGAYTCDASNGVGQTKSYSVDLKVMAAPFFTEEPEIVNAVEDETVTLRCSASGFPDPEIEWIHNGRPIAEASPNPRRKVSSNAIVIEKLNRKDIGNYGCNATNSLGYVYKDVYVNVI